MWGRVGDTTRQARSLEGRTERRDLPAPLAVLAAPVYNQARYLPSAVDSLLAQTESRFALLLVDDASTDGSPALAERYARSDPRVSYHRNEDRLGLAGNWRRCFELARTLYPEAEYFAWTSDHDLWHPRWLEALCAELDRHPEVVLAYPVAQRIDEDGVVVHERGGFDTLEVASPAARLRLLGRLDIAAGDLVYGLLRVESLAQTGVFRHLLEPDRLLLAELSVRGRFRHVPERLWQRRFVASATRARQRRAIFLDRQPLHSWIPPALVRPVVFAWTHARSPSPRGARGGDAGNTALVLAYTSASLRHGLGTRRHKLRRTIRLRTKLARRRYREARRSARAWARRVSKRLRGVRKAIVRATRRVGAEASGLVRGRQ